MFFLIRYYKVFKKLLTVEYILERSNSFLNRMAFYRYLIFYYYFAYLYFFSGLSCVLHFAKIDPVTFVKQLGVFPSLHTLFWYEILDEFSANRITHTRTEIYFLSDLLCVDDSSDLFFLNYTFILPYFFDFFSSWVI